VVARRRYPRLLRKSHETGYKARTGIPAKLFPRWDSNTGGDRNNSG